jgi:hypothetical protein
VASYSASSSAAQDVGAFGDRHAGQLQVEACPVGVVCGVGQFGDGVADDAEVFVADESVSCCGGGLGEFRLVSGEVGCGGDARGGLGRRQVQQVGQVIA